MITVNDRIRIDWHAGMTVRDMLKTCNYTFPLINVTVDGKLIQKDEYDTHVLEDEAIVRVIHLISGG